MAKNFLVSAKALLSELEAPTKIDGRFDEALRSVQILVPGKPAAGSHHEGDQGVHWLDFHWVLSHRDVLQGGIVNSAHGFA